MNTIVVSNSLDPDQDQHYVGPDLDPNHLIWIQTFFAKVISR